MATEIKLVVFDLAGTTVNDSVGDLPLVTVALQEAFKKYGIKITVEQANQFRGMEKKEAVKNLFYGSKSGACDPPYVTDPSIKPRCENAVLEDIFQDFKDALSSYLKDIDKEIPGTMQTFQWLRSKGIKIAVGSGFPHDIVLALVKKLGWQDIIHFASSAENEGYGRPHPSLIHSAMNYCCVTEKKNVLKIGDTVVDVEEGKNAGCWTVAVLTGTQSEERLKQSNPDFIIKSVAELPNLIQSLETGL